MAQGIAGLLGLVVVTGLIHGAEPGHGWPVAAAYAVDRPDTWASGIAASFVLGVGHLVSAVVVVFGFFWAKSAAGLGELPWLNYVAGGLLIALGVYEYVTGGHHHHGGGGDHSHGDGDDHGHDHSHGDRDDHSHGDGDSHDHSHAHDHGDSATLDGLRAAQQRDRGTDGGQAVDGHDHHLDDQSHDHGHADHHADHGHADHDHLDDHGHGDDPGLWASLKSRVPFVGGGGHSHDHITAEDARDEGLWGIAWTAFVLGFAHEEEFELIGICTGTPYCLELTLAYAFSVVFALVGLTALLLAGYERYEDRMSEYAEHFPTISAAVLILMGLGFVAGVF